MKNVFLKINIKKCMTLAETLIVLLIIGVVVTFTIGIIQKASDDIYYETALKKHQSVMLDAINSVLADNGGNWFGCYQGNPTQNQECLNMWDALSTKLDVIQECTHCLPKYKGRIEMGQGPDSGGWQVFPDTAASTYKVKVLKDGSLIFNYVQNFYWPFYAVDINGAKGPNKWGYDVYYLCLGGYNYVYQWKDKLFKPVIKEGIGLGVMVESGGKSYNERLKFK